MVGYALMLTHKDATVIAAAAVVESALVTLVVPDSDGESDAVVLLLPPYLVLMHVLVTIWQEEKEYALQQPEFPWDSYRYAHRALAFTYSTMYFLQQRSPICYELWYVLSCEVCVRSG